jgi:hypothetical protein
LQDIGLSSLQVSVSEQTGYALRPITDDLYLFGPAAVVPWAVQMLELIRPNCAMLDDMFRMRKPYVLETFNLIFARYWGFRLASNHRDPSKARAGLCQHRHDPRKSL